MEAYEMREMMKNMELLNAIEKIRDHCARTDECPNCIFLNDDLECLLKVNPYKWDVDEIAENMMGE